jgi:uncharacterized protein YbaR (Trm112 family)
MRRSLLDILACPIDKYYPLELFEIDTTNDTTINETVINEGVLFCSQCSRYYPIIEEIPVMLPDDLRDKEKDIKFLQKWQERIPIKITKNGNPWHL